MQPGAGKVIAVEEKDKGISYETATFPWVASRPCERHDQTYLR